MSCLQDKPQPWMQSSCNIIRSMNQNLVGDSDGESRDYTFSKLEFSQPILLPQIWWFQPSSAARTPSRAVEVTRHPLQTPPPVFLFSPVQAQVWASSSQLPETLLAPIAPSLTSLPVILPLIPMLATSLLSPAIHPGAQGPRGTNHQLWVDMKPTATPPHSDLHIRILTKDFYTQQRSLKAFSSQSYQAKQLYNLENESISNAYPKPGRKTVYRED